MNTIIALDLEPARKDIVQANALIHIFEGEHLFAITNPPFGRANSLSVKFFNHLARQCEYIAFIVPKSWRKWSIQNRLDKNFHLVLDKDLPLQAFHAPNGTPHSNGHLKTVFQIWQKRDHLRKKIKIEDRGYFKKTSPKHADVAVTAFGYSTGKVERKGVFAPTSNSTKIFLTVKNESVIKALERIDMHRYSKNTAYTDVISMEEIRSLINEYFDNQ